MSGWFDTTVSYRSLSLLCLTNDAGEKDVVGFKPLYLFDFKMFYIIPVCFERLSGSKVACESEYLFIIFFVTLSPHHGVGVANTGRYSQWKRERKESVRSALCIAMQLFRFDS